MNTKQLFDALIKADTQAEVDSAIFQFEQEHSSECKWIPVGGRDNNSGPINVAADPGRSLVERLTNAVDAVLEREHEAHSGHPVCRTPREAASAWLGIPAGGLSEMTQQARRQHADNAVIRITNGEGQKNARTVEIRDKGIGIAPDRMPHTILSLNESNKWQKHYLAGTFGQGGSSTFAAATRTLLVSRYNDQPVVGFTIVKYKDLPPEQFKTGHYVYLVLNGGVLQAEVPVADFERGTLARHYGYDLTAYSSPLGPSSVYGLLNETLFDPILPIWLDSRVHDYRRVIKGSRNALNGAVDEGDEKTSGPKLAHNVRMFYIGLGEFGQIGVEYWVLERPSKQDKKPSAAFVNPAKPIILTINGQNQEEMTALLIRKHAELPYLTQRLICHVDCNGLNPEAKRSLFSSTREGARHGLIYDMIQKEVVRILRSDDDLTRLNDEARRQGAQEMDQSAVQQMRKEVARILQMQGVNVGDVGGLDVGDDKGGSDKPHKPPRPKPPVVPIPIQEPPTYIKILWEEGEAIPFHAEQRRYLRIETNAESRYHKPNSDSSPTNIIVEGDGIVVRGATPLQGGRMRIAVEATQDAKVGGHGTIRIEMMRPGLSTLSDQREFKIVETPPVRPSDNKLTLPPFRVERIEGPDDTRWIDLGWPDDVEKVASSAEMENSELVIYYSAAFPRFAAARSVFEKRNPAIAESFVKRYEIWLAVHSFLWHRDQEAKDDATQLSNEDVLAITEDQERKERCRMAVLSSLFAARETQIVSQTDAEETE